MEVIIYDSSPEIADRLADLIAEVRKDIQVYKAAYYDEVMKMMEDCKPDAVILEYRLSARSPLDIMVKARKLNSKVVTIILAGYIDAYARKQCKNLKPDFLYDKYHEFDKVPAVINSIQTDYSTVMCK